MLTHMHKVVHLVVGIFEQGLRTSPVEYLMVPSALYTKKTEVTVSDRTLALVGQRPISRSYKDAGVSL